jgi:hypothetical protein
MGRSEGERYSTEAVLQGFNSVLTMLDTRGGDESAIPAAISVAPRRWSQRRRRPGGVRAGGSLPKSSTRSWVPETGLISGALTGEGRRDVERHQHDIGRRPRLDGLYRIEDVAKFLVEAAPQIDAAGTRIAILFPATGIRRFC